MKNRRGPRSEPSLKGCGEEESAKEVRTLPVRGEGNQASVVVWKLKKKPFLVRRDCLCQMLL